MGILGMTDDTITVSETGYKTQKMNAYMNVKSANKGLQFGSDKCKLMTIGKGKSEILCSDISVDNWVTSYDKSGNLIEQFNGQVQISQTQNERYLGFQISNTGNNMENIKTKENKAIGTRRQIISMIKGCGKYTFESAFIYLNSLLRGSILYAAETYYDMKESEYNAIQKIEENLMVDIFGTMITCSKHLLYLESGQIPAKYIIQKLKLNKLQYFLQQENTCTLQRFIQAQMDYPVVVYFY